MKVSGEEAIRYQAVRKDTLETVNHGILVMADEETGRVEWRTKSGEMSAITLGPQSIKLMTAYRYGR